jgi:hypothetical protein
MRVDHWTGVERYNRYILPQFSVAQFFHFILIKDPGSDPRKFYSVTKTAADQGLPVFGIIDTLGEPLCYFSSGNPLIRA